jgi:signal transduction histidine kinase
MVASRPTSRTRLANAPLLSALDALARAHDRDAFEHLATLIALHEDGGHFDSVTVLQWEPGLELFLPRRNAAAAPSGTLAELLERAPSLAATTLTVAADALDPSTWRGAAGRAWSIGLSLFGEPDGAGTPWSSAAEVLAVPLGTGARAAGMIVAAWEKEPEPSRRARAEAFAATLSFAAEHHERERERVRLADQASALDEWTRSATGPGHLVEILHLALRLAVRGAGGHGGALWLRDADGGLRLEVAHGQPHGRDRLVRALQAAARRTMDEGVPARSCPASDDPAVPPLAASEIAALGLWPLVAYGRAVGAIAVFRVHPDDTAERDPFDVDGMFMATLARDVALVVDHAQRFDELREAKRRERELVERLRRVERWAELGELSARAAEEARHPLAALRAFASRAERELEAEHPVREYLEVIARDLDRLERLFEEHRAYVTPEPATLAMTALNEVVQGVLQRSGERLVRRRVRLLKKLASDVPALLLDRARVEQALDNLLHFALEAVAVGGRVRLETRKLSDHVLVELGHDGPFHAGDAIEQLFVPFASARTGGPQVGLGVAQRVVRELGGEIRVRSEGEWSTIVSFTLPIRDNQDRRRVRGDRRRPRVDRRGQAGAA